MKKMPPLITQYKEVNVLLYRVLPDNLFHSLRSIPRRDRDSLYQILYKHREKLAWPNGVDQASVDLLSLEAADPMEYEKVRGYRVKRVYELYRRPEINKQADEWFSKNEQYFEDATLNMIRLIILRREVGQPLKPIKIFGGYKTARPIAEFLRDIFKLTFNDFCEVFRRKDGKKFNPNVLSQQPK